jgi:hypothetical protein
MSMNTSYLNAIANHGGGIITHIGLVNGSGTEISGGSYARKAVTWESASDGLIRPTADLLFNIPAGATVAGWRGFTASSGGTNHGGAALTSAAFTNAGYYNLLAADTGIDHNAV